MQGMMGNEDLYSTTSSHFLHSRCTGHFDWEKYRTNVMVCDMQNTVRTIRLRKNTWFEAGLHQEKKIQQRLERQRPREKSAVVTFQILDQVRRNGERCCCLPLTHAHSPHSPSYKYCVWV